MYFSLFVTDKGTRPELDVATLRNGGGGGLTPACPTFSQDDKYSSPPPLSLSPSLYTSALHPRLHSMFTVSTVTSDFSPVPYCVTRGPICPERKPLSFTGRRRRRDPALPRSRVIKLAIAASPGGSDRNCVDVRPRTAFLYAPFPSFPCSFRYE